MVNETPSLNQNSCPRFPVPRPPPPASSGGLGLVRAGGRRRPRAPGVRGVGFWPGAPHELLEEVGELADGLEARVVQDIEDLVAGDLGVT